MALTYRFAENNFKRLQGRFFSPGQSFSQRVIHAGIWTFALQICDRTLGMLRKIVLARLLSPNDFGLFGIALLALTALETFSRTGFQQALIQKQDDISPYLDTAWTLQAIRGLVLALGLVGTAPYLSAFFGEPAAIPLLRLLALSILFLGLTNIGVVYFQKELEFHKQFVYQLSGTVVNFVVAVATAFWLRNTMALILGLVAGNLAQMVMSYVVHPYRPSWRIKIEKAKTLFNFGKWISGNSILLFLLNHGDDVFLGKVLGVTALGLYQMAFQISNLPATEITHVISQVTFPAYSKLQNRLAQLREAYLQTLQVTAFVSFPLAGGIFFFAADFTRIFLGEQWMSIVPVMQILTLWGLIRSISATTGPLFQAVGRPAIGTWLQLSRLILMASFIYPLTLQWGIRGTALAVVASALLVDPIAGYCASRIIHCNVRQMFKLLAIPALGTGVIICSLSMLKAGLPHLAGLSVFVAFIAVSVLMYAGLMALFDKWFDGKMLVLFKQRLYSIRSQ